MSHLRNDIINDCDHITDLSVYSPHTERKGEWSREINYRVVKIFFNKDTSTYTLNDDAETIILEGRWEVDNGRGMGLNYVVENWKYCPKCGENIEPKVIPRD